MNSPSSAVEIREVTRMFGQTRAVASLSLTVRSGEIVGLVGPDGAGKTTTLRLLAGLLDATSGEIVVADHDLRTQAEPVKPRIGYMAQHFSLYEDLTVTENLTFFADLYGVSRAIRLPRMDRLLAFAGLVDFRNRRAADLSGGMQKKLALACTLVHQPQILLLDEPTTGVDPISRREFWSILTDLHLDGATIIVSTPYMDEAERCQKVGLMHAGQLIAFAEPRAIQEMIQGEMVELRPQDWRLAREMLARLPGVKETLTQGTRLRLVVDSAAKRMPEIEAFLSQADLTFSELRQVSPRMEEAFISLVQQVEA